MSTQVADHEALSADAAAQQVAFALWPGVRYLGGWQRLVDRLAMTAREAGADAVTSNPVRTLGRGGSGWTASTDDGEYTADVVVLAAGGPERAARLLGRELSALGPPAHAAALDLPLRRLPQARRRFALGLDTPHYLSVHSPRGGVPVHLSIAAYLTEADRGSGTRAALEWVADLVQPGWRGELLGEPRHLARMRSTTAIPTPQTGGLGGRHAGALPDAPGLALAGDWVGPEGMLMDAALASARSAAATLLTAREAIAA